MSPMLSRIYTSQGGVELLDALMKYMYVIFYNPTDYLSFSSKCLSNGTCTAKLMTSPFADTKAWRSRQQEHHELSPRRPPGSHRYNPEEQPRAEAKP